MMEFPRTEREREKAEDRYGPRWESKWDEIVEMEFQKEAERRSRKTDWWEEYVIPAFWIMMGVFAFFVFFGHLAN